MEIFWLIYFSGLIFALYYVTNKFIAWCVKNKIDHKAALRDWGNLCGIAFDSLGSWITVIFYYLSKDI
jgi:hypothetical protein